MVFGVVCGAVGPAVYRNKVCSLSQHLLGPTVSRNAVYVCIILIIVAINKNGFKNQKKNVASTQLMIEAVAFCITLKLV